MENTTNLHLSIQSSSMRILTTPGPTDLPEQQDTSLTTDRINSLVLQENDQIPNIKNILAGCALAIGGNLLISVSLNLQKYTHVQNAQSNNRVHYTRKPLWWVGLVLMALGEVGNFAAYGFAPASLVAPLGTTTVIVNAFIAVFFLKEELKTEDLFGGSLAIIGAFLLINFSSKTEEVLDAETIKHLLQETAFIVYIVIECVMIAGLLVVKYYLKVESVVVMLLICNLIASFTVIAAKAVSSMLQLTLGGDMQLTYGVFWFMLIGMAVAVVIQLKFLNQAMQLYESSIVVPTNFVFFTISAIVAGVIFYKEFYGLSPVDAFMFLFGCLMCFVGVYFITVGRTAVVEVELSVKEAEMDQESLSKDIFPAWLFPSILRAEAPLKRAAFQRSTVDLPDTVTQPYRDDPENDDDGQITPGSSTPQLMDLELTSSKEILEEVPDVDLGMIHSLTAISPQPHLSSSMEVVDRHDESGDYGETYVTSRSNSLELLNSQKSSDLVKSYGSVKGNDQS